MEDFDFEDLELETDDELELDFDVVYVKFSKYSKEYAYITYDDVKAGDKVYVPDKEEALEVIRVENLLEKDLPVEFSKMKHATLTKPFKTALEQLRKKNPVLRLVEKQTELIGREDVVEDLICSINKKRIRNSILIGDAGCGKTTIVESLSETLKNKYTILSFNVGELISGTTLRGMAEEKLTNIFNDAIQFNKNYDHKIILFIDEFHMIVTDCGCMEAVSLHDILKPYFTNPNIIVIGATTVKEYNEHIKKDFALMRRITPIYVNHLSASSILKILDNFSNHEVEEELLLNILNKTKDIPNTTNPDISLEVLDRIISKHEILGYKINLELIDFEINKLKESYKYI